MTQLRGRDRLTAAEIAARITGTFDEILPSLMEELYELGLLPDGEPRTRGFVAGLMRSLDELREQHTAPASGARQGGGGEATPVSHKSTAESTGEQVNDPDARRPFSVPSLTYTGEVARAAVPRFDGAWRLTGDFMVLNDIHIPATNWEFAEMALDIAERHLPRPRRCLIVGDLINGDALSRWDNVVQCTPLADELDHAGDYLEHLSRVFDEIYFSRGNHENRILFSLKGQLHAPHFRRMITDSGNVHFSLYTYLRVLSGGIEWHLTHQKTYSRNALTVARKLSSIHKTNVICTHQHHSAAGRDDSNTLALIDSGGLHDSDLMAYVGLEDSTSPVMQNGFVLLRGGVATLFTPPEYNMMDWTMWNKEMVNA